MKVYLADLVHTWEKSSTWTFPLNVGYVGAYAQKMFGDAIEVRLFKRPEKLIKALKEDPPDVLGLGYYVWNANLNDHVARIAKRHNPKVAVVGGGPNFTSINNTEEQARKFFRASEAVDVYVVNQGERGFSEFLRVFTECQHDVEAIRGQTIGGVTVKGDASADRVQVGAELDAIRDLDEIPSPYLNGLMDEFFDEPFAPVLETNRSCPYRCTFCAWGIGTSKLSRFSEARVKAEIEYIGQRCRKAVQMFISDANFGVLERDALFGRWLAESNEKYGFPGHLAVQWHKARPDRVLATAREVRNIARIGASMQSLHSETLTAVKRKNMPLKDVMHMLTELRKEGVDMPLVSELILGLPEETRESHLAGNRTMIDLGAEMINYNLYLLPGTEMDNKESREKYFHITGWRLMDNAFGVYDGVKVFEGQETVQATSTMSRDELRGFRFYHFLLQFMWGGRWYYDYLQFFKGRGIHVVDIIDSLTDASRTATGRVGKLYADFCADHDLEAFKTYEEMCDYWADGTNFERLRDGSYGKLNYGFTYKVLLECRDEFDTFLLEQGTRIAAKHNMADIGQIEAVLKEILRFGSATRIRLTDTLDLVPGGQDSFAYDVLSWRGAEFAGSPEPARSESGVIYEFYLPEKQRHKVKTLLEQYRSHNINLTLRKMSEYIKPHEFFYQVRTTDAVERPFAPTNLVMVPQSGTHDSWGTSDGRPN
jgi:radical SAM superfamily enzyme YgiQ (UPF0313 family)